MFKFSLIFAIIGLIFAFFFQEPTSDLDKHIIVPIDERIKSVPTREDISFPLFLPLLLIGVYGFLIGGLGLAYPIKSELLNFPLFSNYLFYFFRMGTQTTSLSKTMDLNVKKLKKFIIVSSIVLILTFISMGLTDNIAIFGILFCFFGIFNSFYYSLSFKLIVFKNIAKNTSKYSVYFETVVGVGFFFAPIIIGFIAKFNVDLSFYFLALLSLICFGVYLAFYKKIKD